jgi:hypothetical protein
MREGRLFIRRISDSFQALRPKYRMRRARAAAPGRVSTIWLYALLRDTKMRDVLKDLNSVVDYEERVRAITGIGIRPSIWALILPLSSMISTRSPTSNESGKMSRQ